MGQNSHVNISIDEAKAVAVALEFYNINVEAKPLPGEVDYNFRLTTAEGLRYLLKISREATDVSELVFQESLMNHLATQDLPFSIPQLVPTIEGDFRTIWVDAEGVTRWVRLQTWVEGRMLSEVNPRTSDLFYNWGKAVGQLTESLNGFDHEEAHRIYKWDPSQTLYSRKYLEFIEDVRHRKIAAYFWDLFEDSTLPRLPSLRMGVNYNDAHEHNLLVDYNYKSPSISGIIDFGDALYTHKINELAIACAYACMYVPDPLLAAVDVIRGYHQYFPLLENEVEVLYSLIAARLLITVSNAAWNRHEEPNNEYLSIHEKPAWQLLEKWMEISSSLAHYRFRDACGWEPCTKLSQFNKWIDGRPKLFPLIDFENRRICELDLSVGSLSLGNNSNYLEIEKFKRHIIRIIEDQDASIGVGGYGETRPLYTSDSFQSIGNDGALWRTVHLGLDLWLDSGAAVYAPLSGVVHSCANNQGDCNYGPTIILEHAVSTSFTFYTLYGHLSVESLEGIEVGQVIEGGSLIAHVGTDRVNGNWPPHLHYQIILDDLGLHGDFPGVAFPNEKKTWLSICPDPRLLILELEENKNAIPFERISEIIEIRKEKLGPSLSVSYDAPLHIVRGYGPYLFDIDGRRYLDTVNNVAHVGHEHPRVVKAAQQQTAVLNTNTRYLHENIVKFAEALLDKLPPELCVVHFVNSGSEANELAIRMAKTYSGYKDMIAIEVGYHGNTGACIDVSSYKFEGKGGGGAPEHTHILPIPDVYRGMHKDVEQPGVAYSNYVNEIIKNIREKGRGVAGFIGESIISCGGQVMLPEGYLKHIYSRVRAAGGLCIADEVQVGFGRVGKHFWGFELQDVIPDIVTMGKPIGNGHGLAAVVITRAVADRFANGMEYFNTFGGNPVSCAIGLEVLRVIKDEGLQQNAAEVGMYLKGKLQELQSEFTVIGDVRGEGLFLGFELVRDRNSLEPADFEASYIANRMRERGILMSTDGPFHNVIKIKPPMVFSKSNVDFLIDNLRLVFKEDFLQRLQ